MPQRAKVAIEKKIEIVRKCLENEVSIKAAGQEAGVNAATVALWIRLYETEGISGLQPNARNRQYSTETKMRAVLDYLGQEGSLREICKKYKIRSVKQLGEWLKVYNAHGDFNSVKQSGGGSYMKQGRKTTKEERLKIVKDCLESGKNYGEIAPKYQVSYQQVRTWTQRFEEMGEAGLEDRRGKRKKDQIPRTELEAAQIEIKRLKHKLYMAEMERDLLKKLDEIERRDVSHK